VCHCLGEAVLGVTRWPTLLVSKQWHTAVKNAGQASPIRAGDYSRGGAAAATAIFGQNKGVCMVNGQKCDVLPL